MPHRRPSLLRPAGRLLARAAPLAIFGLIWQGASASGVIDPAFLPKPTAILVALSKLLTGGEIAANLFVTLLRAFGGLALGALAGVWLGLMMARFDKFRAYVAPLVGATYSLPKTALVPLLILWFGIGSATAIWSVFLACLLPMVVHTYQGVAATPNVLIWSAQAMGASRRELLTLVFLRSALPDILTGLRIALGFSFVLAISTEMIASTSGIGKLIFLYGENGAYDYMFAAISGVVIIAFAADRAMLAVNTACLRWHESAHTGQAA